LIGAQGFALTTGAVQGEHQTAPQAFPIRVLRNKTLQIADTRITSADLELAIDAKLHRSQPQFLESGRLVEQRWHVVRQRAEWRPPPHRKRFIEQPHRSSRVVHVP